MRNILPIGRAHPFPYISPTPPQLFGQLDLERRLERNYIADIREAQGLAEIVQLYQPQVVLHLSAQPLVPRSYRDPLGTWATNVLGILHVLEASKPLQHPCAVVMVTTAQGVLEP